MGIVFLFVAFIFESSFGIKGCKKKSEIFCGFMLFDKDGLIIVSGNKIICLYCNAK